MLVLVNVWSSVLDLVNVWSCVLVLVNVWSCVLVVVTVWACVFVLVNLVCFWSFCTGSGRSFCSYFVFSFWVVYFHPIRAVNVAFVWIGGAQRILRVCLRVGQALRSIFSLLSSVQCL